MESALTLILALIPSNGEFTSEDNDTILKAVDDMEEKFPSRTTEEQDSHTIRVINAIMDPYAGLFMLGGRPEPNRHMWRMRVAMCDLFHNLSFAQRRRQTEILGGRPLEHTGIATAADFRQALQRYCERVTHEWQAAETERLNDWWFWHQIMEGAQVCAQEGG